MAQKFKMDIFALAAFVLLIQQQSNICMLNAAAPLALSTRILPPIKNNNSESSPATGASDMDARVDCRVDGMFLIMNMGKSFTGRVYPKGFSKTPCAQLYANNGSQISYDVPMNTCNTMVNDFENGTREYFNMIVVQHHLTLMTKQDRSYAVRCRYRASEQLLQAGVGIDDMEVNSVEATAVAPAVEMSLLADASRQADFVNIGDLLTLQLKIPPQRMYGILVHSCVVRDGAGVGGLQVLFDDKGCPVDPDIMGALQYQNDLTRAHVTFKAHKFPYTTSLYYECHVHFCLKPTGECDRLPTPPQCGASNSDASSSTLPASASMYKPTPLNPLRLMSTTEVPSSSSSYATITPASTTAFTTLTLQPTTKTSNMSGRPHYRPQSKQNTMKSNNTENEQQELNNDSAHMSISELPPNNSNQPIELKSTAPKPNRPLTLNTSASNAAISPEDLMTTSSSATMMKRPLLIVEHMQLVEPVSTTTTTPSTTTLAASLSTTTTTQAPALPVLQSRVVMPETDYFAQQQFSELNNNNNMSLYKDDESPMIPIARNNNNRHSNYIVTKSQYSSSLNPMSIAPLMPPSLADNGHGYAAVEPLDLSELGQASDELIIRKVRSPIAIAPPPPSINGLGESLGGDVTEFAPKSSLLLPSARSLSPPTQQHVQTLIGYYDGHRDDDFDFIRTRRHVVVDNDNSETILQRVRRNSLTSSSSSIEVGRSAREAKVVRGLNVIDVSEPVPSYLMQQGAGFKPEQQQKNAAAQADKSEENSSSSSSPPPPPLMCLTTTTFAAGVSTMSLLCVLSAIVLGAAVCARCRQRSDDESEMLASECAATNAAANAASMYNNSAMYAAAAAYPTTMQPGSPYSTSTLLASPPNMPSNIVGDSPIYRYSGYMSKPFSFT